MKFSILISRVKLAFTADETLLEPSNNSHCMLIDEMQDALYEIWEYSKTGNVAAFDFMHSKLHDRLVQFRLDFGNTDIPSMHKNATYRTYKDIMKEVNPLLHSLRKEMAVLSAGGVA